jgi:endonuclease YncB( thermonuclease family)
MADDDKLQIIRAELLRTDAQSGNFLAKILAGIDAPELAQEYGHEAKQVLADLIGTRTVSLSELGRDKYGRYLAQIHCGDTWINKEMLLRGAAWTYLAETHFDEFKNAEALARAKRLGLWSADNPKTAVGG